MANTAAQYEPVLSATTHRCSRFGHPEFILRWDDRRTLHADVRALGESLEAAVARGARFEPGATIAVGWVPLRVVEAPSRALLLVEPDFVQAPLRYVPGVDSAIGHLRSQEELADRVGMIGRLALPSIEQTARVCPHATAVGAVLDRVEAANDSSGWIVGCGLDSEGEDRHPLATITLYELICRFPHLVDVLALPPGSTVACTNVGDAIVWHNGEELGFRSGQSINTRLSRITDGMNLGAPLARCSGVR
jgi:hypothetical protein